MYLAAPLGSKPSSRSDIHLPESSSSRPLSECSLDPCPTAKSKVPLLPGVLRPLRLAVGCRGSSQAAKLPSPVARFSLCDDVVAHVLVPRGSSALSVSCNGRFLRLPPPLAAAAAFGEGAGWSHERSDCALLTRGELPTSATLWRSPPLFSVLSLERSTVP